jgi:hypothetical protein
MITKLRAQRLIPILQSVVDGKGTSEELNKFLKHIPDMLTLDRNLVPLETKEDVKQYIGMTFNNYKCTGALMDKDEGKLYIICEDNVRIDSIVFTPKQFLEYFKVGKYKSVNLPIWDALDRKGMTNLEILVTYTHRLIGRYSGQTTIGGDYEIGGKHIYIHNKEILPWIKSITYTNTSFRAGETILTHDYVQFDFTPTKEDVASALLILRDIERKLCTKISS